MIRIKLFTIVVVTAIVAVTQTARASITLADLDLGGTISVGDKTFSGFSYTESGLTSFDPSQIIVTATEANGVDYLTWSGNISLASSTTVSADLKLNYIVTASAGSINMIDQSYTGSAQNGFLAIDETAAIGNFGGTVAGSSHLTGFILSNPPTFIPDNLNIVPPQTILYVTKDIGLTVLSPGGFDTISQVSQSFHQTAVPEPTTMISGVLLLLPFGASTLRILRKNRAA